MINFNLSNEKKEKILDLISDFIYTNQVTGAECVYQVDHVNLGSVDLVAEIVEVIDPEYSYSEEESV
jgi:hypothetical protein